MKYILFTIAIITGIDCMLFAQTDTIKKSDTIRLEEVIINSNKVPIQLKNNPGATSLITEEMLAIMPKGIGAEEALRLVPGLRIDNQHDGERVHLSIRGQGILTERGVRGIGVILDGIPINDPSGFASDLYDVDWSTINKIEVLRGPAGGLYGGGGSGGVINITTNNGGSKPIGGLFSETIGSNGFSKSLIQLDGTKDRLDYRVSYSRTDGDGARDHQAFWSNKLYEKVNFYPTKDLVITQILSHTDYFQQNPEGLNMGQFDNLKQANPDARPFNEYQKTNRTTAGLRAMYKISEKQDVEMTTYLRSWDYKETSNKCAEYRNVTNPGATAQYNLHVGTEKIKNHFSVGGDFKSQNINMYKLQSAGNTDRVESIDETNLETSTLLANQIIKQQSVGVFGLYKLDIGRFSLIGNVRYDNLTNQLSDKMAGGDTAKTTKEFENISARLGASYAVSELFNVFVNWSSGFTPPSTEELASNPTGYSGFNTHLVPSTVNSYEVGTRGFWKDKLYYEVIGFNMDTKNDFFRFKQTGRGNQEVFYGNAGNSNRKGIETFVSLKITKKITVQVAYTYADYKYTSASVDPIYTNSAYVLTTPPASGQELPNSPKHQVYGEVVYAISKNFKVSVGTEYQSDWAIYTDAKAYSGALDPSIYQNWEKGFNLYNARATYLWNVAGMKGECSVSVRNLTGEKYMAFTEPDPDGNSYQPGPGREIFGSIKVRF